MAYTSGAKTGQQHVHSRRRECGSLSLAGFGASLLKRLRDPWHQDESLLAVPLPLPR